MNQDKPQDSREFAEQPPMTAAQAAELRQVVEAQMAANAQAQ